MINLYDQSEVYNVNLRACIRAVYEGFPHLALRDIIDPPHEMFDAALARQIVMHLMVREFHWPKRRVVEVEGRSREAINRALRTIEDRLILDRFATHYQSIADRARDLFSLSLTGNDFPEFDMDEVA